MLQELRYVRWRCHHRCWPRTERKVLAVIKSHLDGNCEKRRQNAYLAEAKVLMSPGQVQLVHGQALLDGNSLYGLVVDLHGAARKAILLLQARVLQEQRLGLLRRCLLRKNLYLSTIQALYAYRWPLSAPGGIVSGAMDRRQAECSSYG